MGAATNSIRRVAPTSANTSRLTECLADLIRTLIMRFDSYRPELHYMRGPGPKWHAKNDPKPHHSTMPSAAQGRPSNHRS
jgi:hypothetical protein